MRPGIEAGESYVREVAAFLLVSAWLVSVGHLVWVATDWHPLICFYFFGLTKVELN